MVLPNQLTVLRIILTPVFFFLFLSGEPFLIQMSAAIYIVAAVTDWYDGWLARRFNYITEWGKFLDPLADKILTSTAFLALVLVGILELWMVLIIVFRDIIITGLRVWADYKKVSFSTSKSAKWKTFFQMAFQYYLLLVFTLRSFDSLYREYKWLFGLLLNQEFIYYTMLAITIFTFYTGLTYFISNFSLIKKTIGKQN